MTAATSTTTTTTGVAAAVVARDSLAETSPTGEFQRRESAWRNVVQKNGEFPPEVCRYHLYVAYAW